MKTQVAHLILTTECIQKCQIVLKCKQVLKRNFFKEIDKPGGKATQVCFCPTC